MSGQESHEAGRKSRTRRSIRWILYTITFLGTIIVLIFVYWYFFHRNVVSTNDARIAADTVDVSPQIMGKLDSLFVAEGDTITRGQVLFQLDRDLLEAALNKSLSDLATANRSLEVAQAQYQKALSGTRPEEIAIAKTALSGANERLDLAEKEWNRVNQLYQDHSVTEADWEQAHAAFLLAQTDYQSAQENLRLLQAGTRPEDREIAARNVELSRAQVASLQSVVTQAQINLDYATVTAPFGGIAVRVWREPGSVLSAGTPVLTVFDLESLYVSANVEEQNIHRIRPGDRVTIDIDAYPGITVHGYLDQILPAANSEFGLIPSQGVSGTFIKVSQRVQLVIRFDRYADIQSLRLGPGLSVEAHINTEHSAGVTNP